MKRNTFLLLIILFSKSTYLYSQTDWELLGNIATNPTTHFVGTQDDEQLTFATNRNAVSGTSHPFYFETNGGILQMTLDAFGNLDLANSNKGYEIATNYVLRHNGIPTSIYVGVNSGHPTSTNGLGNTFVGYGTGLVTGSTAPAPTTTQGSYNTFLGNLSGNANDRGTRNVFIGNQAGYFNLDGFSNVFIGNKSGYSNLGNVNTSSTQGNWNTFTGHLSGEFQTTGFANCYYGKYSGNSNVNGQQNSFYGSHSGDNTGASGASNTLNCMFGDHSGSVFHSGHNNIFIGANSQNSGSSTSSWNNISNSTAIGANSLVPASNQMILGGITGSGPGATWPVYVGVGLSHDGTGPTERLEINSSTTQSSYNSAATTGSGLKFRQLTSGSSNSGKNYTAPHGRVLTVDGTGIVKLTDDKGGIGYEECTNGVPILNAAIGMDLSDYQIYYDRQNSYDVSYVARSAIGLGYSCGSYLPGKLSVDQTWTANSVFTNTTAGYFHNGDIYSCEEGLWEVEKKEYTV